MSKVAIVKAQQLDAAVDRGLQLLGGLNQYIHENDRVLIKPNLCAVKPWESGVTTDPLLTEKIIERVKEFSNNIAICESNHSAVDAESVFDCLGYTKIAKKHGVELLNLSETSRLLSLQNPSGFFLKEFSLHEEILKADLIINLPVMKTNEVSTITLSLKNMFGILPTRQKARFHSRIHEVIADINYFVGKTLIILDGRCSMEGNGPLDGEVVHLDTMIFGDDMVATDYIGTQVMGFDPMKIEHIKLAESCGIGSYKHIELLGVPLKEVIHPFKPAEKISQKNKVRYTVLRSKFCTETLGYIFNKSRAWANSRAEGKKGRDR